jgi:iron complex transport system permease protein
VTSAITSARLVVGASVAGYRRRAVRRSGVLAALAAALALSLLVDASVGPGNLTLSEILQAFVDPAGVSPRHAVIVWDIRLPVAIMAALIGAMLGAAGAQMQTILANPSSSASASFRWLARSS